MVYMRCSNCGQYIDDWRIGVGDKKIYCDECVYKGTKSNPKTQKGKRKS
jgi:formylmethanofuran dehydrogenase subunit E